MTPTEQAVPEMTRAASRAAVTRVHAHRIVGLDCGRLLAVVAVIFIHAQNGTAFGAMAELLSRFAVPYFFVQAGFFLSRIARPSLADAGRTLQRLYLPFAIWVALYLVIWIHPAPDDFRHGKFILSLLVQGGPVYHLWFLPSLALCSLLLLLAIRLNLRGAQLAILCAAMYGLALVLGNYLTPLTGHAPLFWDTRTGPLFGFPLMAAGLTVARLGGPPRLLSTLLLLGGGALLMIAEVSILQRHGYPVRHDLLLGTFAFGLGAFLLASRIPAMAPTTLIAQVGRYSLGIYAMHFLFLEIIGAAAQRGLFIDFRTIPGELAVVATTSVLSTAATLLLSCIRPLRFLLR